MTEAEKIETVQTLVGNDAEATDSLVSVYLADAYDAIMHRLYPQSIPTVEIEGEEVEVSLPKRYERLQCKLASRYFLRRGAEGEIAHNENGINRGYASVNDEDLLSEVMQVVFGVAK